MLGWDTAFLNTWWYEIWAFSDVPRATLDLIKLRWEASGKTQVSNVIRGRNKITPALLLLTLCLRPLCRVGMHRQLGLEQALIGETFGLDNKALLFR